MLMVGVDTGATGAICMIDFEIKLWRFIDIRKDSEHILHPQVIDEVEEIASYFTVPSENVAIERVWGMPGQSSKTTWSQASIYAQLLLIIREAFGDYTLYTPTAWKKPLGLIAPKGYTTAQKKEITLIAVREWFPWIADDVRLKKHDGRADALCVALHHYKMMTGGY